MATSLLDKLNNGENIYGTCILSTSPIWSKVVGGSGLDFVFLDTEHIPMDRTELTFLCQIYSSKGISPIVRIPSPDPYIACMAKDAGAVGVLAPYVESIEQIQQLVGATKHRPLKGGRLQNVLNGKEVLEPELKAYLENYNKGSLCIVNIESLIAVDNLDALLEVDGLDGIIIGPHDLSINMGLPEQYDHPDFEKVVKEIITKARSKNIAAGIHFPSNPDRQIQWMKEGANIVMHSSDMFLFSQKLNEDLLKIKNAVGDHLVQNDDADLAI
jgi:4-hydroxy-2-oxoheptanedioate aldolase|tara:strand:- start:719 stop:1531 length:813 start_codon:yes stop_codon:yes gene_type:complete